ncbi:MAG TPA: branched-chain amino acid ABC transporter substrate-binding protein [Ardenticatenaceae bacterium]|jgi:branched-chain amino acid transport system substrate-binding protein
MRKTLLLLLLVLSLMLAACNQAATPAANTGGDTGAATEEEPAAEEEPAEEVEPTEAPMEEVEPTEETAEEGGDDAAAGATGECTDEIGCVEIAEGDPIHLAYMMVTTGENEQLGLDSRNGMEIAIADRGGELLGREIELTGEDEGCSAEGGQTAATRVTADPTVLAIVGTSCSSAARTAIPLVTEAGMVMISSSNTAPDLTAEDRGEEFAGYLRTAHNDLTQGRLAAEFAYNELGITRAATIHDGSPYAESLQQVFADVFTELGGEITSQEAVNVGDTDMRPVLTRIAADEPELIYYPIFVAEAAFVTSQAREVTGLEEVALMGADASLSQSFVEAAGDAATDMYLSGPLTGESAGYEAFLATHEEMFGGAPLSGFHAHAYDATMMILDAIEQVAVEGEDGTLIIGRQALRDALYATSGFEGLTGSLTCNPTGDCATGEALAIYQVTQEVVDDVAGTWPPPVVYQP